MAFIGNTNTTQAFTPAVDYFSGNGSTVAFTLSRPVASVAQVQVVIDNVAQNPSSAYTISGSTITFTSAPLSGTNNIYVYYTSPITQVIAPGQGTVTSESFGTITNFTTTGNTVLGDATTDTLTVGVTGIVKDSSGNVGIGTASPTAKLTVNNATATDYLSLTTAGSTKGVLADEAGDLIIKSAASLLFQTNGSIRARLNTTGALVFAGGTTTADGIGITFPATQSASTNANTLDDYEEGTWTPTLTATTTNPTITSTNVSGRYIKIGSSVTIFCSANWGFTGGSGSIQIGGIPFACSSSATLATGSLEDGGVTMGGSYTWGGVLLGASDIAVSLRKYSNANAAETAITIANQSSGAWIRFTLTYQSA